MLADRRILIVEDDYSIARALTRAFEAHGAQVVGPYPSVASVMAVLATTDVSGASLDVELLDGRSYGIAAALRARDIPFVFATGHHCHDLPQDLRSAPRLMKPVEPSEVVEAVAAALAKTG